MRVARERNALLVGIVCFLLALGAGSSGCGSVHDVLETDLLEATLDGANEVPPVETIATGRVDLVANHRFNTIAFDLRTDGLADIISAHVHFGDPGVVGPVLFTLSTAPSPVATGLLGSDDLTPDPADGINSIDDAITAMTGGRTYVEVHTSADPDGEIRGQTQPR